MKHKLVAWLVGVAVQAATSSAHAVEWADIEQALTQGETRFSIRYRHEFVDQQYIRNQANASTVRPRITWTSGAIERWRFGIEADYVLPLFDDDYEDGLNPSDYGGLIRPEYPTVADPEGFDWNQAFVRREGEQLTVTGGRQRILIADQRFIGGVAWRQNEQTYDALRVQWDVGDNASLDYGYIWNVNRIFGPEGGRAQPSDWHGNTHYIHGKWELAEGHAFSAFGYLFEFRNGNGINNSNATFGATYHSTWGPVQAVGTLAVQSDHGESTLDYHAAYASIAAHTMLGEVVTLRIGYDMLGSDEGRAAFRTPSATLHKFQGWTDKFLTTPLSGVEDFHVGAETTWWSVKTALTFHAFSSHRENLAYGTEINLVATVPVGELASVQLKFAQYQADNFAEDTTKAWLVISADF